MELIMVMKPTNFYKRIKVPYCYRWYLDQGLVLIWSGVNREFVVILKVLFVSQKDSAYSSLSVTESIAARPLVNKYMFYSFRP